MAPVNPSNHDVEVDAEVEPIAEVDCTEVGTDAIADWSDVWGPDDCLDAIRTARQKFSIPSLLTGCQVILEISDSMMRRVSIVQFNGLNSKGF